ncbi:MAG: hypothetical protein APR54_09405 [Candidatus Cloacimonas sp. SDB]|nr:MAG: hypothetical protein APR54_09405 [Candidatus Cloacimonas sp. SDB]
MKLIRSLLLISFILLALTGLSAQEKDYRITRVFIEAELNYDGSMLVQETRTFYFQGKFSYLFRTFPKNGPIAFTDISVAEGAIKFKESTSQESGTFTINEDNKNIRLKWFITAQNESRTFHISYKVLGAVKKFQDSAVLYHQFISPEWDKSQYDILLTVKTPELLNRYNVKHWLHGPLWAESRLEFDGTITAWCDRLPARNYFEIRALYPISTFPEAPQLSGFIENDILEQEAIWAEEANAQRQKAIDAQIRKAEYHKIGAWLIPLLSALLILFWIFMFCKYGKRPKVERAGDILAKKPDDIPPALASYLLNSRTITGPCLIATILDLAQRNLLNFEHTEIEKRRGKYQQQYAFQLNREIYEINKAELQDFEIELIEFLFSDLNKGDEILQIKTLKKNRHKFQKFFSKWKKVISRVGKEKNWFDKKSIKAGNISLIAGLIFLLIAGVFVIWFSTISIILAVSALIVTILSAAIPHHTFTGKAKYNEWKAFRKYLKKYHYRDESEQEVLEKINDLFIYGALFGLKQKVFKELGGIIPSEHHKHYLPWYIMHSNRSSSFTPDAFGKALASMISTTGSAMSSASGAGGGASSGGGGGSGSGGGGAG